MDGWHDVQATLSLDGLGRLSSLGSQSPAGSYLEVLSLPGSNGEGWSMVDFGAALDLHSPSQAIFNPGQTLHLRSNSDSSDGSFDMGNHEDVAAFSHLSSPFSPAHSEQDDRHNNYHHRFGSMHHNHNHHQPQPQRLYQSQSQSQSQHQSEQQQHHQQQQQHRNQHEHQHQHQHHYGHSHSLDMGQSAGAAAAAAAIPPPQASTTSDPIRTQADGGPATVSETTSPTSTVSPSRRMPAPRKSPITNMTPKTAALIRRTPNGKDGTTEKKVGRRRGPLRPEQRKQASEIRKLRACLRCKFLKKTCDTGEPCTGCQPSHARLWQVPCTRIDIKDIAYFMKDWKADYERHMGRSVSVYNVKGFSEKETLMWITHGFGVALPVMVREVYVADDSCFLIDWVESSSSIEPIDYHVRTEKLDVGSQGISMEALSEYLDKHIDGPFEDFVDEHFDGTPFVTEILKTAHRFFVKEKLPVIRKALKLVVAYNLTLHITMIENTGTGSEADFEGEIDDEYSRFHGKTVAPVMVNYQIKCAMADMWRELQKEILEELSSLYSSVYSGDRLKNWPTIFLLAAILLAVWEEIQFDCHYRTPNPAVARKFCNDMETTPVGVIVGLFHAISQKLPPLIEWSTSDHGHILNNNPSVSEAMTEVREHVTKHGAQARPLVPCTLLPLASY